MAGARRELKVEPARKRWLSAREAKSYLGCGDEMLKVLRDNAEVRFSRYSNRIWYDVDSIDRFVMRNKVV